MLKITAIGNLTNDVELKVSETTGKPDGKYSPDDLPAESADGESARCVRSGQQP